MVSGGNAAWLARRPGQHLCRYGGTIAIILSGLSEENVTKNRAEARFLF